MPRVILREEVVVMEGHWRSTHRHQDEGMLWTIRTCIVGWVYKGEEVGGSLEAGANYYQFIIIIR